MTKKQVFEAAKGLGSEVFMTNTYGQLFCDVDGYVPVDSYSMIIDGYNSSSKASWEECLYDIIRQQSEAA